MRPLFIFKEDEILNQVVPKELIDQISNQIKQAHERFFSSLNDDLLLYGRQIVKIELADGELNMYHISDAFLGGADEQS